MKHLKRVWNLISFKVSRLQLLLFKRFWPSRALILRRQGERHLLITQLERSIGTDIKYREVSAKRGGDFKVCTKKIELRKQFLVDISTCAIKDFESLATKWMDRMQEFDGLNPQKQKKFTWK